MRGQWLTIVLAAAALAPTGCPPPEPAPPTDFSESRPAWDMPELAVTGLVIEPERANPGDVTLMRATVVNRGSGASEPARLVFLTDGQQVGRASLDRLAPGQQVEVRAEARIRGEGIHIIRAELELAEGGFDASAASNFRIARARIAGVRDPDPELEFAPIDFDTLGLAPRGTYRIPVMVRNPGFARIGTLAAVFQVDGETMARTEIGPLGPGERQELNLTWPAVTPGEHVLTLRMELPERFPFARHQSIQSWHVAVPDVTVLSDSIGKDKWASVGPRQLEDGWPAGSVGRMDAIAIHPTNADILYACAPSGGIWKSTDGGGHWTPLGDKLEKMGCTGVALDPQNPSIVYFTTGHPRYRGGWGVYKSVNGGVSWQQFATKATEVTDSLATNVFTIEGAYRPVIRYTSSGQVLIYLASNHGVLRYTSSNPLAGSSTASEWTMIKSGIISDLVVSPSNPSLVYAAVHQSGVFRTTQGVTLPSYKHSTYWTALTNGLPDLSAESRWVTLDLGPPASGQLYAGVSNPPAVPPDSTKFSVYRLLGDSNAWLLVGSSSTDGIYNPFLRCHPTEVGVVYFGGVKLYKKWMFLMMPLFPEVQISNIHDDMKDLKFVPNDPTRYYLLSDGGVFRCTVGSSWTQNDTCVPRNYDLRVTQFYDLDVAPNNAYLMIGGTQDNGTIIWNGQPDWSTFHIFNYGDGYYSLIAPKNPQVMYAQFQSLDSTARSADGGKTWSKASNGLPKGWNMDAGYITAHPNSADYVLSQGDQVYATFDGGQNWTARGPKGSNVKGHVTKVLVQPSTFTWIAGTSQGQLWSTSTAGSPWSLEFEHPYGASVAGMAFAPADHRVLFVSFAAGGAHAYTRLWRFEINPGPPVVWTPSNITDNFPSQRTARVISGDGHSTEVAYIGTESGVFRGKTTPGCGSCVWNWQPYNNGLPLVRINDLLVDPASKQLRAGTWGRGAWAVITGP